MTVAGAPNGVRLPVIGSTGRVFDRARIERDLRDLGLAEVRFGHHDRMLYSTDASLFQVEPIGVVVLAEPGDAEKVVRYCAREGLPILPRGGGTALAGQTVNEAVVMDFSAHCRRILEVDTAAKRARVQPGVVLDQLNAHLAPMGLMFGPDVATTSHANLGGMIGNNSAGMYSIRYGRTVENLLGLTVLLADGRTLHLSEGRCDRDPAQREIAARVASIVRPLADEIRARYPRITRHVDGYNLDLFLTQLEASTPGSFDRVNLAHLVCGSEGTLAVTLEAELRLVPRPRMRGLALASFAGVDEALGALGAILSTRPAAAELVDEVVIGMAMANTEYRRYVELLPRLEHGAVGAVMYVEYFGESLDEVHAGFAALERALPRETPLQKHTDPAAISQAIRLRRAGEPLLHGVPGDRKPVTFVEDTAVDPGRLRDFVREFHAIVARHGTTAAYYAHASVGCLHIRPLVAVRSLEDREKMVAIAEEVADLVVRYHGALSGEHGDGRIRSPLLDRVLGPKLCAAFRAVKEVFDPAGLMNPGILVDGSNPRRILDHHRVAPHGSLLAVPKVTTFFDYEREEGFAHAIEQCNGAGICRRMTGGTMCPSYRATLDERHATRGRGNALRLAVTGQFGSAADWSDAETQKTLDLCLSCKACKSECPSNVDIAKLKSEFTAQRFASEGRVPRRERLFGAVRRLNRLGSMLWPVANAAARSRAGRAMAASLMGIDSRRSLPEFGPSLLRWWRRRQARAPRPGAVDARCSADAPPAAPAVILIPDCFTLYNEPRIGHAAVELLEAFGYRVVIPEMGCCGRSMISQGMLADAIRCCASSAVALIEAAEREGALALVGCEPSCVSAIKDDWQELRMGVDRARLRDLAAKTHLVEEFLDRRWDQHPRRPALPKQSDRVLLHAHCHQKALWGADSSAALLRRLFPGGAETLDTGCCGMAGSFGLTREHFELSQRIAELSLFPALRSDEQAIICASGTSCRHQIRDGLDREALHPVELAAKVLLGHPPEPS